MSKKSFLNYLEFEKRYSDHTIQSYANDITKIENYLLLEFEIEDLKSVQHYHIRSWMVSMLQNGMTAKSINRKLSAFRSYFQFLKRKGIVERNPLSKIVAPKIAKRLPSYMQEKDVSRLDMSELFNDDFSGIRDRLIFELLYQTGMRRSELIGLICADINVSRKVVKVLGKGSKERLIPISQSIIDLLRLYLKLREAEFDIKSKGVDPLIVTDRNRKCYPKFIYTVVNRILGLCTSLKKRSPHVLRHTFATQLSNNGAELNAVKALLGHSSLAATQVYTHNNIKRLQSIYEKAHPKA